MRLSQAAAALEVGANHVVNRGHGRREVFSLCMFSVRFRGKCTLIPRVHLQGGVFIR